MPRHEMGERDQLMQGSGVLQYIAYTTCVHANVCERVIA